MADRPARRGPISIGDALDVEAALRPGDAQTRAAIDVLLGLDRTMTAPSPASLGPWKPNEPPMVPESGRFEALQDPVLPKMPAPPPIPELTSMRASPRPVGRVTFNPPEWATLGGDPFLPLVGGTSSLAPPPLFQPIQARVILSAALATIHDGTEVDAERATAAVAEGRRMERIPFRRIATLRRGAQVLVDRSPAMDPLRHDIEHVLSELRRILGPGRLQILDFLHCPGPSSAPLRGVWADGRDRQLWKPPGRGVPVLVISDVTMAPPIGGRESATASEWLAFFTELHAAQCHGVALVPFSPGRWPPLLSRAATFLHWSERTTARQILQALRESRARLRGRR